MEVQVRLDELGSKVRLVMLGGANNEKGYININVAYTVNSCTKTPISRLSHVPQFLFTHAVDKSHVIIDLIIADSQLLYH